MIWLSPTFLEWTPGLSSGGEITLDRSAWLRAYEIWHHAEELLSKQNSDFARIDAIMALRRVVDHRLKVLNRMYDLKRLPIPGRPDGILETLAFIGAVRPHMLTKLIEIRNLVEHEDAPPPCLERCLEFVDFTWYFLRSTDSAVQKRRTEWEFEYEYALGWEDQDYAPQDQDFTRYFLRLTVRGNNGIEFELDGWLPPFMVSSELVAGWLAVSDTVFETRAERMAGPNWAEQRGFGSQEGHPEDVFVRGSVRGTTEALKTLARLHLGLPLA